MNARGTPTAAYQVLHLLSCTGGMGTPLRAPPNTPHLGHDTPCRTWPGYPPPQLDLAGVPPCQTWMGYPPLRLDLAEVSPPPSYTQTENIIFPHPSKAVVNNDIFYDCHCSTDWFTSGRRKPEDPNMFYWTGDGEVIEGFQSWLNEQDRFTEGHDTIVYHYDGK